MPPQSAVQHARYPFSCAELQGRPLYLVAAELWHRNPYVRLHREYDRQHLLVLGDSDALDRVGCLHYGKLIKLGGIGTLPSGSAAKSSKYVLSSPKLNAINWNIDLFKACTALQKR